MARLVWNGRSAAEPVSAATAEPATLCTEERYGDAAAAAADCAADPAAPNRLILGEAEAVLPTLAGELAGRVALVYVDPPFDTGGEFHFQASIPGASESTPRIAVPAYRDARGLDAWLGWFLGTARHLHALLAEGGSLYVHLDTHVVHYAKVVLDEVFGPAAFQRQIIWRIGWVSGFKSRANNWIRNHDVILFYVKASGRPARKGAGVRPVFHKEYVPYPPGYVRRDGVPPRGPGYPIDDVWNGSDLDRLDSIQIMSFSGEKVGFPTQKNEALVSRIVRASSRPGDLVLDCFVGSGTTAVVAEKLGRRWIACDAAPVAIHAARKRLLTLREPRPFVVQRAAASEPAPRRKLSAHLHVEGPTATVELASLAMPERVAPPDARAAVGHFSQWIDGWCVDWDHDGSALRAGSRAWRRRSESALALTATHSYDAPGDYLVLVKAFDVLGGATTKRLRAEVRSSAARRAGR